ncbi:hypothetical protein IMSAGC006_02181 [Muribaculaceae bacterium]|nr:hypothetical protein IMSAGC006_02181 [Muribaculaceae bacterium]
MAHKAGIGLGFLFNIVEDRNQVLLLNSELIEFILEVVVSNI